MATNPFHFNRPTDPADFLGRTDEMRVIVDDLCNARGDSHAIIGGRRFGKSSFLEVLYDELIKRLQQVEPR
ncbi:MAG: hypothetical protein M1546_08630 [Chloroflexi bacterium]|nr:hypothetical protein [Chloroflexota bacterium]